jgi:glucan biosynthesis protein C
MPTPAASDLSKGARQSVPTAADALTKARRYDLDWIRVCAFGLLILYHVELVYSPFDWHIRSAHTYGWMRQALLLTSPWRLTLLFLVSGAALRLMSARKTAGEVLKARLARLAPPLIFGVVALVPIQSWIEWTDKGTWSAGLPAWMAHELSPAGVRDGLPVNHLWFLVYICAYSLAILPLLIRPALITRLEALLVRSMWGWRIVAIPLAYLLAIRLLLFPFYPVTNQLVGDWYNHALSFGAFLFGFLMVRRESIWIGFARYRWFSLCGAVLLPLVMIQDIHPGGGAFWGLPRNAVFAINQWAMVAGVLGFAYRHLRNAANPVLSYLNDAIFPCYLAHQTILVLAVWLIKPAHLPAPLEALSLITVTFLGSLAVYEVVRRIPPIRPLWGLKPLPSHVAEETPRYVRRRRLLAIGMLAPVLAMACVVLAILAYPGFDNARQYLSELGGASAKAPIIFNFGVFTAGLMAGLAGAGFGLAIVALTNARFVGGLTAAVFLLAGAGLATAAIYPWPDPRHLAVNLGLGIQMAPLLLLWGLRRRRDLQGLKLFLTAVFVLMAVLTVLTKHLVFPSLVNDANVGWWERAYAVVLVGWVGIAAFVLDRRLLMEGPGAEKAHSAPSGA